MKWFNNTPLYIAGHIIGSQPNFVFLPSPNNQGYIFLAVPLQLKQDKIKPNEKLSSSGILLHITYYAAQSVQKTETLNFMNGVNKDFEIKAVLLV